MKRIANLTRRSSSPSLPAAKKHAQLKFYKILLKSGCFWRRNFCCWGYDFLPLILLLVINPLDPRSQISTVTARFVGDNPEVDYEHTQKIYLDAFRRN